MYVLVATARKSNAVGGKSGKWIWQLFIIRSTGIEDEDLRQQLGKTLTAVLMYEWKTRERLFTGLAGAVGIEPTSMVLETTVLPLNYAPIYSGML